MTKLSVNINKIATLRNSRQGLEPNLIAFARKIISYGAHGITIHPRADERHITRADVFDVAREITAVETNFEGDLREGFLDLVFALKPAQCTLVPVRPGEVTSDHGWDFERYDWLLEPIIKKIKSHQVRVSLFVDAGYPEAVKSAARIGADRIEIYTEPFAKGFLNGNPSGALDAINLTISEAKSLGLGVNAGHDLTHQNLRLLQKECPGIDEVSIGHHLISHALEVGMQRSVSDYLEALV